MGFHAIDFGPVPDRWERVYSEFDEIYQGSRPIGEYEGNVLVANAIADDSILSEEDKSLIHIVCERFKSCSSREISAISHKEPLWQKYHESHSGIPFIEAFFLS